MTLDQFLLRMEFAELMSCLFYLLVVSRREYDDHITRRWFMAAAVALTVDIFIFHRMRPPWVWALLNIPAGALCYEKIYRKIVLILHRKLVLLWLSLLG